MLQRVITNWLCARMFCAVVCVFAAAILFGCAGSARVPVSTLTFLYTSNTRAYTEPCGCCSKQSGGLPIRAGYLEYYRATFADKSDGQGTQPGRRGVLVLDAGGFSDNSSKHKKIQSRYTAQAIELMRYDVVNLGSSEMLLGQTLLAEVLAGFSNTKVVSANWKFSSPDDALDHSVSLKAQVKPYLRKRVGKFNVFITGVSSPAETHHLSIASSGIEVEPIEAALKQVFENTAPGDLVVVLVNGLNQTGVASVESALSSLYGQKKCPGVIVGHGETKADKPFVDTPSLDTDVPFVTLINPPDRGRGIAFAEVTTNEQGTLSKESAGYAKLEKNQQKDEAISKLMGEMAAEINETDRLLHAQQAGEVGEEGFEDYKYIGSRVCRRCHQAESTTYFHTKHSAAYQTLKAEGEHKNAVCLPCHTTGYGEPGGFLLGIYENPALRGVGCETCHGAGTYHRKLQYGDPAALPPPGANDSGLHEVTEQTCIKCHTAETDLEWNYEEKLPLVDHSAGE